MHDIAESIVNSCLDRESARKLNRFRFDDKTWKRLEELRALKDNGQLTRKEDLGEYLMLYAVHKFIGVLQMKARSMLRRPAQRSSAKQA